MINHSDEEWIAWLGSDQSSLRDQASVDLRDVLTANLRGQFLKRGLSQDCVEDVVQEALLRIIARLDTFRGDSRFISWATAVGIRTGLEMVRKQYWKTQTLGDLIKGDDVQLSGPWESTEPEPELATVQYEILDVLSESIQYVLSERQRTVLLAELKGMPTSEIAVELDTTRGAVYKIAHDARKKLKSELERMGFDQQTIEAAFHQN